MAQIKKVLEIPVSRIILGEVPTVPDSFGFRTDLQDLMDSLQKVGQLQPILVFEGADGKYEVLAGRRRVMAFVQLRARTIWAAIMDERVGVDEGNAMWLSENLVRKLHEDDIRAVMDVLLKKYGSVKALVHETGIPLEKVQRYAGQS